ncbi:MAG TPA: hypothetical protein VHO84_07125 [Syntrophorhabdaceae bacterium]|nr:hypothetical protein [Syntrophorhabdaceae bacterium]
MKRLHGAFAAMGEDGNSQTVLVYSEFINEMDFEDPHGTMVSFYDYQTAEGLKVTRIKKGEFLVAHTNIRLKSKSLEALNGMVS